jgi:glycosyltransferase involved in cell wall biosynthesis
LLSLILSRRSIPLKILHIASGDLWAGAEVQAYTLLCALQNFSLKDNREIQVAAALLNEGELAQRLRARGIEVFVFPEATLNSLQILLDLRRLMRSWQPDIVHTHRQKENILGAIANRLAGNAPSVRTVHGASEHVPVGLRQLHKRILQRVDRWVGLRLQHKIVAVSRELLEQLAGNFPRHQLQLIENGVDVEAVRAQTGEVEYRQRDPQAVHVGIAGRLVPVKRVDIFLEMAAQLRATPSHIHWRFHIFGDGPLRQTLTELAERLDLMTTTTFHGHRRDIVACLAGLDVLTMCSDHEGLPMTILETMALEIPIVAHAAGGLTDVLADYPKGQLVIDHTPAGYAAAVARALNDTDARRPFSIQRFSAQTNALAMARMYAELARPAPVAGS